MYRNYIDAVRTNALLLNLLPRNGFHGESILELQAASPEAQLLEIFHNTPGEISDTNTHIPFLCIYQQTPKIYYLHSSVSLSHSVLVVVHNFDMFQLSVILPTMSVLSPSFVAWTILSRLRKPSTAHVMISLVPQLTLSFHCMFIRM